MIQKTLFDAASSDNSLQSFVNREARRMWPSETHRKRSLSQLNRFARFRDNQSRPIAHFLPRDVHDFVDHLIDTGSSEATANRYMSTISKVFNHAVNERVISAPMKLKFFHEDQPRPRIFTPDEITAVIDYCVEHNWLWLRDMFVLSLKTGMRRGEVVALGQGRAYISDCGDWVVLPAVVTKTKRERFVPIANPAAKAAAIAIQASLADHYTKRKFDYRWSLIQRDVARNDPHFVFHVSRHNCASFLANDLNANVLVIAKMLGHRNIKTTERYVKAKPDTLLALSAQM